MRYRQLISGHGFYMLFLISLWQSCATEDERIKANNEKVAVHKVDTVVIQQMKFLPAELTVNKGDTVTWINRDIVDHNVTEEANKEWSSSTLHPGNSFTIVVTKNAAYFCTIHPVMKGRLILR